MPERLQGGRDPLAELAKLIGGAQTYPRAIEMPQHRSYLHYVPDPKVDAIFYSGSILVEDEPYYGESGLTGRALYFDYADPARDAFFYRDIHAFRIAEN